MRILLSLAAAAALAVGLAPAAHASSNDWTVDVSSSTVTWGGSPRMGTVELEPHVLASPANSVSAEVAGSDVVADVRGLIGDDEWTEWREAPAVLPQTVTTVQVRLVYSESGRASSVSFKASAVASKSDVDILAAGRSYKVFATREGLVGGTTANGHVIKSRDHFVALPSRRGLASNNNGNYSVQVCASNGRCEWAPVWDVGPWNTKDDYWNPASVREMWKDLPQGKPEAQAAFQSGYNGGKDQFGRRVPNPAGIDLADGTFWDGLKLTDNSWVTVTYLWTGSGPAGVIRTEANPLNVRSSASSSGAQVGLAAKYAQVRVLCQTTGERVTGTQGTSNIWYRIAAGKYVAKAYVSGVSGATTC
ncbi:hypothetical protein Lesp02_28200 [Lentzea sp. NBRC 105346]|uniref:SH3 domain-containing protein n=1 Tax=Lentzea sp. NBRC 105346 TaxID=3032205 RepID=UPI0025546F29|nr:SH3 domain-containing protein [Lentzea sp. NBRC 105346]GLZ30631.1 hypothetical protein Lesp02_28200 [Lentzea sp. NBRC 105346]